MASSLDIFFKLGDKVTKGDPMRQQDFTYYMLWILFLAFTIMFISNVYTMIERPNAMSAVWSMVGFAIMSLQFFNLKSMHDLRTLRRNQQQQPTQPTEPVESVDEMLKAFKQKKGGKHGKVKKTTN